MKNRLPSLPQQTKICIICEGDEEYEYLDKLKELDVWNEKYDIVLENADGNTSRRCVQWEHFFTLGE